MRIRPGVIAQSAATAAVQLGGRFVLGVGSRDALNEHIVGDPRPSLEARLDMLEEAASVIGAHRATRSPSRPRLHRAARIYTRPQEPVSIMCRGSRAPQAAELAGRVGDGYRLAMPDADLVRAAGGGHKPVQAETKVNWDADRDVAAGVAHRPVATCAPRSATSAMRAATRQLPLPRPRLFADDAMALVSPGAVAETIACGPANHTQR
jgi:G6PDH family F420-dependent oxidoreductase